MRGYVGCPMAEKKGGNFSRDAQRKLEISNFSETVIKVAEFLEVSERGSLKWKGTF
jgi:hypothetical protein